MTAPSIKEALTDLYELIEVVTSGEFYQDYDASTELLGRADRAFKVVEATLSPPAGERRDAIADWSDLPRDIYVIGAQRMGAVVFDVQCCSVPMVMAPEVRYVRADILEAYTATLEQKLADAVRDNAAIRADEREKCAQFAFAKYDWPPRWIAASFRGENGAYGDEFFSAVKSGEIKVQYDTPISSALAQSRKP